LCNHHDVDIDTHFDVRCALVVHGAVVVGQGQLHSILSTRSQQYSLLWEYYRQPLDAASLLISDVFPVAEPRQVHVMQRQATIGTNSVHLGSAAIIRLGVRGIFHVGDDLITGQMFLGPGPDGLHRRPVADILLQKGLLEHQFEQIPMLCVPAPIVSLVLAGRWSELLWLARWPRIFTEWPPAEWISNHAGKHYAPRNTAVVSTSMLQTLSADLRGWAPRIVSDTMDGDDDEDDGGRTVMRLEQHIRWLDDVVSNMRQESRMRGGHQQVTDEDVCHVIRCLLFSKRLRQQTQVAESVEKALQLLPLGLREMALQPLDRGWLQIPSASSLQRFQLSFDVGFMLWRRAHLSTMPAARFGFADASPQGGRDWFLIKVHTIENSKLVELMEAVTSLHKLHAMAVLNNEDEPMLIMGEVDRVQLADLIFDTIKVSTSPPVALGLGKTSLQDKAAALCYAFFLECGWDLLPGFLNSFSSFTTDMGTEMKLNEFASINFNKLLPTHVVASRI
jgi:hypothetical protein